MQVLVHQGCQNEPAAGENRHLLGYYQPATLLGISLRMAVSPHSLLLGMFCRKNETSLAVKSEERWLNLQVTEALSVNTIS